MKVILSIIFIVLIATVSCSTHLRTALQHEDIPFLNNMNPLQIAQLMSGDYVSILPASIQPIVRAVLGQQQQSGVSGFLSQAQNILGGGSSSNSGGLLGGMGSLLGQAGQQGQNGVGSLLGSFGNALGGGNSATGIMGLPNSFNLNSLVGSGSSLLPSANPQGALQGLFSGFGHD
jgi:hypothetical protein